MLRRPAPRSQIRQPHAPDGLARSAHDVRPTLDTLLTVDGRLSRTIPCMSSAQASGQMSTVDARGDVDTLCAILFELLTPDRVRPSAP